MKFEIFIFLFGKVLISGVLKGSTPLIFQKCKEVGQKVVYAAREFVTVFPWPLFLVKVVGQMVI